MSEELVVLIPQELDRLELFALLFWRSISAEMLTFCVKHKLFFVFSPTDSCEECLYEVLMYD